jgi:mono/diheme cytochrome c family protein
MRNTMYICHKTLFSLVFIFVASASQHVAAEGFTVADGAKLYNDNCGRCHNPKPAEHYTAREWSVIMPHMRDRAHLTGKETEAIERFLASTLTADVNQLYRAGEAPEQRQLTGKELFDQFGCQGCHRLKDEGGSLGPRLGVTYKEKGEDFMVHKILNPALGSPSSTMPKFPLSENEARSIVKYIGEVMRF